MFAADVQTARQTLGLYKLSQSKSRPRGDFQALFGGSNVQAKWPFNRTATSEISFLVKNRSACLLAHYVTTDNTERTQGRAEQHCCSTAIGNPWNACAEEHPAGKIIPASCRRDGDDAA